jgi:hypothetical protein
MTMAAAAAIGLAQGNTSLAEVLVWSAGLIGLLVVGMAFAARLKRRFRDDGDDTPAAAAAGFTLSDLRRMHRAGQLTDEEFERAKEKIVAAAQRAAERAKPADGTVDRDSPDAIRARRLAREAQERADLAPGDADPEGPGGEPPPRRRRVSWNTPADPRTRASRARRGWERSFFPLRPNSG